MTEDEKPKNKDLFLPLSILVAGVMISGSVIYSISLRGVGDGTAQVKEALKEEIALPKIESFDVILGDSKAPVTLIEFGDYQCPFCGKFFKDTEPLIRENYIKTGKVKMVWRDFAFLGPESLVAAQAVHCAKDQGKYWEFHDAIIEEEYIDAKEHNGNLNEKKFLEIASSLKMNTFDFKVCITSDKYKDIVKTAYDLSVEAGVNSTPTLFINNRKVQGALPYTTFKELIEKELIK